MNGSPPPPSPPESRERSGSRSPGPPAGGPAKALPTDVYADRIDAGRRLAGHLEHLPGGSGTVVLGLPRGGVPVAYEVARELGAVLDIMVVRKLGVPGHEELAMGAIASGGVRVLNERIVRSLGIDAGAIEAIVEREQRELARRESAYRGDRPAAELGGKTVVVVDDGLATGASMRAAVELLRQRGVGRLVVAVPVAPPDTVAGLGQDVDEGVCPMTPSDFGGVGRWYRDFTQTTDDEVRHLLAEARRGT